jgi:hypothetical protein
MRTRFATLFAALTILAVVGCAGTPQQQADKAHGVYVGALRTTDQLILQHRIPKDTEKLIRDEIIPAARISLTAVDLSVPTGGVTFNTALNAFYDAMTRWAEAQSQVPATTQPTPR